MKRALFLFLLLTAISCGNSNSGGTDEKVITVSIAPFSFFVKEIGGSDFSVNIMVPPGSDPHVYEPFPDQISRLRRSEGYISNGYLGFEDAWLSRFYEANRKMKKLSLGEKVEAIRDEHHDKSGHTEGADPHYWVSPACALSMAVSVRDFLKELNPAHSELYDRNLDTLSAAIRSLDSKAHQLFSSSRRKVFMIYHPNLAYLARDYGLTEVAVEAEGKEPSPSGLRDLIDIARKDSIKSIFVQKEYDKRNARAVADETGAELVIIDPLSPDWFASTNEIIEKLAESLK